MVNKKEGMQLVFHFLEKEHAKYLAWIEEEEAVKQMKLSKDPNAFVGGKDMLIADWKIRTEELKEMMDFCSSLIDEETEEDLDEEADLCGRF